MQALARRRTSVFDSYWAFAAERLAMYERRLAGERGPWTDDPILRNYRFTNSYRAADRVSQYLIGEVQYGPGRSQAPAEIFFRTLLFKFFNKIETWERLEKHLGALSWQSVDFDAMSNVLSSAITRGERIYSAAYIMPSPAYGFKRKHENHLALLNEMMSDGLPGRTQAARTLADVYKLIRLYRGLGPFLAFQYTIDLNYSSLLDFKEEDFVVAGPGALDGIAKCFEGAVHYCPEDIIYYMADIQEREFERRGLQFRGLFGRRLMPIDCQNLFCEISKYARVAHPTVAGVSNRTRIKQGYEPLPTPLRDPVFPPRWSLTVPRFRKSPSVDGQICLFP